MTEQFVIDKSGANAADMDTFNGMVDGRKMSMMVDPEICRDVYFDKDGNARIACQVVINGFTFHLFPGRNDDVPEAVAEIILSSPENSKHATYSDMKAPEKDTFNLVAEIKHSLRDNMAAVQQINVIGGL